MCVGATNTFDGDTGISMKLGDLTASCRSNEIRKRPSVEQEELAGYFSYRR